LHTFFAPPFNGAAASFQGIPPPENRIVPSFNADILPFKRRMAAVKNSNQGIIYRPFESTSVKNQLVLKCQNGWLPGFKMLEVNIAAFAEDIHKKDGALGGIDAVIIGRPGPS
jgi:hypothetical protein